MVNTANGFKWDLEQTLVGGGGAISNDQPMLK